MYADEFSGSVDERRTAWLTVYCATLEGLRAKEEEIRRDLREGIRVGTENITLNDVYEWKKDKKGFKQTTKGNYSYMYEHFVRDSPGKHKLQKIRKSDVRRYYNGLQPVW